MKAFIVGGSGNVGQEVAMNLMRQEGVEKVILGDINADPAGLRERLRRNKKISLVQVDARDYENLAGLLKDADVAVNCAGPFHETALAVAKAAVEARIDYIDICDDYEAIDTLFSSDIDKAAKETGITVLTGMGSDPGTNNIIAAWYARRLDRVHEIALFWAVSIAEIGGAALEHSLHMTMGKIPQFLDARLEYVEGGTGAETVQFPEPLGACVVRYVGHPQPLTMPRYIKGLRNLVVKGALVPAWVDQLIQEQKETGLLSRTPVDVKGVEVAPYDLAFATLGEYSRRQGRRTSHFRIESDRQGGKGRQTGNVHGGHGGGDGTGNGSPRLDRSPDAGCRGHRNQRRGRTGRLYRSRQIPFGTPAKRGQNPSDGNGRIHTRGTKSIRSVKG